VQKLDIGRFSLTAKM